VSDVAQVTDDAQARIAKALDRARAGEDKELAQQVRDRGEALVNLLTGTARMTHIHHIDNKAFQAPCRELAATVERLHELLGLVQLVMVEDQVYINDIRLRFEARNEVPRELALLWRRHETGGVTIHTRLDEAQVKALVIAVVADPTLPHPRTALQAVLQRAGMAQVELQPVFRFVLNNEQAGGGPAGAAGARSTRTCARCTPSPRRRWATSGTASRSGATPTRCPCARWSTRWWTWTRSSAPRPSWPPPATSRSPAHSRHSIQVASLSVLIGREVGLPEATLADLGVAASFHDGGYTSEEDGYPPPFERHTTAGARQLLKQRGFHEARIRRLLVCLEHHRSFDDDRHPSLFARIIHVADDYDTLTRYRPAGPLLAPPDALARMYAAGGTLYDPVLLQAFINRMGKYPPGSILELDDRSWVLVLSGVREPGLFDRPLTRLVRTPRGERPREDEDIDLAFGGFDVTRVIRPESPP
jgi:HD-GYP domain-containing protein (c-di-GMP phosphodiesterase class II)